MTAIVTCGEMRQSLAAVRALGRAGIPVAVAAKKRPCLAMWSRYATSTFLTEGEASSPERFVEQLAEEIKARYAVCALVSTDDAWWALSRFREFLPDSAQKIFPPHYSVVRSLDLEALHHFAKSLVIPCAKLIRVPENASEDLVLDLIKHLDFPLALRPIIPWFLREEGGLRIEEPLVLRSREQLIRTLKMNLLKNGFLVSAYVAVRSLSYFGFAEKGQVLLEGFQERLNEFEPGSERTTLAMTIQQIPILRQHAQKLLAALQWQGPFKVEFIKEKRNNYKLLRVVGRLWDSLELAIRADVNIPLICYRMAEGNLTEDLLVNARSKVQVRWLAGDALSKVSNPLQALQDLKSVMHGLNPRGLYQRYVGKEKVDNYFDVLDPDDPMPFIFELQDKTWKKVFRIKR